MSWINLNRVFALCLIVDCLEMVSFSNQLYQCMKPTSEANDRSRKQQMFQRMKQLFHVVFSTSKLVSYCSVWWKLLNHYWCCCEIGLWIPLKAEWKLRSVVPQQKHLFVALIKRSPKVRESFKILIFRQVHTGSFNSWHTQPPSF